MNVPFLDLKAQFRAYRQEIVAALSGVLSSARFINGPQVTYKNVGVGGDFITRVWDRLNQNPRVYRLSAYDGIFEPKPTMVLIFLGHNDSKVNSKSGIPCVPRKRFAELFPLTINKIKAETGAWVIVMSAASSAFEVISKNGIAWEKKRLRGFSKFGIPAVMEEFNAMMKKAAADTGAEYLDVYTPTKNYPNKPDIFIRDGVLDCAQTAPGERDWCEALTDSCSPGLIDDAEYRAVFHGL
jgi:lysophospholipase L1-like esterase